MKKIYRYQIVYIIGSTLLFLFGLYSLFFMMNFHPMISIELILCGLGLDATVITSIFENRKKKKGSVK